MQRVNEADVIKELEAARHNVRVLMAYGDGGMKRKLGIMGEYRKHREAAAKAVIDNAWYLAILLDVVGHPGVPLLGRYLTWLFKRRQKAIDVTVSAVYKKAYGEEM